MWSPFLTDTNKVAYLVFFLHDRNNNKCSSSVAICKSEYILQPTDNDGPYIFKMFENLCRHSNIVSVQPTNKMTDMNITVKIIPNYNNTWFHDNCTQYLNA